MEHLPYAEIQKGTFLIATPDIEEGIFFRAVVLVCEHNPNGSFGIIINKSLSLELPEDIINVDTLANPCVEIRAGGAGSNKSDDVATYVQQATKPNLADM